MSAQVDLVSVEFKTDHPPIRKVSNAVGASNLVSNGVPLQPPHWKAGSARNHPASFTKGRPVKVELTLRVGGIGTFLIEGKGSGHSLVFQGLCLGNGGSPKEVKVSLQSNALPNKVTRLSETITWTFMESPTKKRVLATTGPHELFVLWGKPLVESSHWKMSNHLTYDRLRLLTDAKIAGNKSTVDQIASAIHQYVNNNALSGLPNIAYSKGGDGGQLWGLLPGGSKRGQCAELSYLMEMMNRLLGIEALQKHIRASTTAVGIERRLSYEGHTQAADRRFETRTCARHGTEVLQLTFGYARLTQQEEAQGFTRYAINEGEGTCEVNGKLYPGLLSFPGLPTGGRTAAHNILLACEKRYAPNIAVSKKTGHRRYDRDRFQVWVTKVDRQGNYGVCEVSKDDQLKEAKKNGVKLSPLQADPFPPVPR